MSLRSDLKLPAILSFMGLSMTIINLTFQFRLPENPPKLLSGGTSLKFSNRNGNYVSCNVHTTLANVESFFS